MLYASLFKQLEQSRWSLENDIPWASIDRSRLTERHLHGIKMNALLD